jgi:uncharacterized protein YfaP (DUF2135 family)
MKAALIIVAHRAWGAAIGWVLTTMVGTAVCGTSLPAGAAQPAVSLDQPRGGWRVQDRSGDFVQEVNYPASRVNLGSRVSVAAQIRGRLHNHGKGGPAQLVANGNAMPLEVASDGQFQRPYAFASGSNSVEVSHDGVSRRVQFLDGGQAARPRLRVLLSWDGAGTDVDLHVISPSGKHCFFANRVIEGGGALDVDVTTGYGPEIFAAPRPERGVWQVYVNYFGGGYRSEDSRRGVLTASVTVLTDEGLPAETRREFRVPLRSTGDLMHVASFSVR